MTLLYQSCVNQLGREFALRHDGVWFERRFQGFTRKSAIKKPSRWVAVHPALGLRLTQLVAPDNPPEQFHLDMRLCTRIRTTVRLPQ